VRVLIVGGTGNLSSRIAEACAARGDELLLFNRGSTGGTVPPGARVVLGDRNELRKYRDELLAFRPDAVVDAVLRDELRAREAAEVFASVGRYVFLSTVDVYGEDVGCAPVAEDRTPDPKSAYGKDRLAAERFLFSALPGRTAVFRLSHILGRGFLVGGLRGRTPYLADRIRRGKPVPAIDGGRNLMTPVHAADAAEWIRRSLDLPDGVGLFNACGPEIITQQIGRAHV
jgi:nucleoside-diphosphate-sugar epimerase